MYQSADRAAWRARVDGTEPDVLRWHQIVRLCRQGAADLPPLARGERGIALIGFASDEGVVRNQGRVGAAEGPAVIRSFCAGLPVHFDTDRCVLADLGTVSCPDQNLEQAQEELGLLVAGALQAGYRPLVLGGGHEVSYGHWLGVRAALKPGEGVSVLNFDAHYDLREIHPQRHSGNSFSAIADDCRGQGRPFRYAAVGIQKISNTRRLFDEAGRLQALTILAEEAGAATLGDARERLGLFLKEGHPLMLTLDLDVFSASTAPGVSAPNAVGLLPGSSYYNLLRMALNAPNLLSVDIAELNPRYDLDNRTARLAAAMAFEVVVGWLGGEL